MPRLQQRQAPAGGGTQAQPQPTANPNAPAPERQPIDRPAGNNQGGNNKENNPPGNNPQGNENQQRPPANDKPDNKDKPKDDAKDQPKPNQPTPMGRPQPTLPPTPTNAGAGVGSGGNALYITSFPADFPTGPARNDAPENGRGYVFVPNNKLGDNMAVFAILVCFMWVFFFVFLRATRWAEKRSARNTVDTMIHDEQRWAERAPTAAEKTPLVLGPGVSAHDPRREEARLRREPALNAPQPRFHASHPHARPQQLYAGQQHLYPPGAIPRTPSPRAPGPRTPSPRLRAPSAASSGGYTSVPNASPHASPQASPPHAPPHMPPNASFRPFGSLSPGSSAPSSTYHSPRNSYGRLSPSPGEQARLNPGGSPGGFGPPLQHPAGPHAPRPQHAQAPYAAFGQPSASRSLSQSPPGRQATQSPPRGSSMGWR